MNDFYSISVRTLDGNTTTLDAYRGQVLVIVNVASQCGFTPQYEGLEALYREAKDSKVAVLGFPCNQFGGQEPGTDAEIAAFCETRFGVSFPMFSKIDVNGSSEHPRYSHLKSETDGKDIQWNFEKFLVDAEGNVVGRYGSSTKPEQLKQEIAELLS